MKATVSEKGQVTIPKGLRTKLGLRPGTVIEFEAVQGKLVGTKKDVADGFAKWQGKGKLPAGLSVDQYLELTRG